MNIGLLDAIKIMDNGTTEELAEIANKYKVSAGDALVMAMKSAAKIMKSCVPMKPETCREEDKKVHMYCPGCEADISFWQEEWEFCPFCGQAIRIQRENE